jgi:hypothetical protein
MPQRHGALALDAWAPRGAAPPGRTDRSPAHANRHVCAGARDHPLRGECNEPRRGDRVPWRKLHDGGEHTRWKRFRGSPEAVFELEAIGELLSKTYARDHKFPVGRVGPTPARSCCGKTGYCALDASDWDTGLWHDVGYKPKLPPLYQFSYESDGSSMSITAVGDMDCDKTLVTYKIEGSIEKGVPVLKLVSTPMGVD